MKSGQGSVIVISVDLDSEPGRTATAQILDACTEFSLPATWSSFNPRHCPIIARATEAEVGHDFGLRVDDQLIAQGRTALAHELARQVAASLETGLRLQALSMSNVMKDNLDLLVKHQIPVIRTSIPASGRALKPHNLRFGVWHAPVGQALPTTETWGPVAAWRTTRRLRKVDRSGEVLHLGIDGKQFAACSPAQQTGVLKLLERVRRVCDSGSLKATTIARLVQRQYRRQPLKSILRAA